MDKLTEQLAEALRAAKSKIKDMEILFKEASELEGLTIFVCGGKYDPTKTDAALSAYEKAKAVCEQPAQVNGICYTCKYEFPLESDRCRTCLLMRDSTGVYRMWEAK